MMKKFLLLMTCASLAACSFEKDKNRLSDNGEIENRQALKSSFEKIKGTYAGTLTTAAGKTDAIELVLDWVEVYDGSTNSGADKPIPKLTARLRRTTNVKKDLELVARHIPETGELILIMKPSGNNGSASPVEEVEINNINARIQGQRISGEAKTTTGYLGHIELQLISKETASPESPDDLRYIEALRQQLLTIAGTYEGTIVPESADATPYTATIVLAVYNKTVEGLNIPYPYLIGNFHRHDDPGTMTDLQFTANYNLDVIPNQLTLNGTPIIRTETGYRADFTGTIEDGEFRGVMQTLPRPFRGTFLFKKVTD